MIVLDNIFVFLEAHDDHCQVVDCSFSLDGSKVVSGSKDNTVRVWDVVSGEELVIFEGHSSEVSGCVHRFLTSIKQKKFGGLPSSRKLNIQ